MQKTSGKIGKRKGKEKKIKRKRRGTFSIDARKSDEKEIKEGKRKS